MSADISAEERLQTLESLSRVHETTVLPALASIREISNLLAVLRENDFSLEATSYMRR